MSRGTQRSALPRHQSGEINEPTSSRVYSHVLYPCATIGLINRQKNQKSAYAVPCVASSYPVVSAHSRVGRGNLVLRHSIPRFVLDPMSSRGIVYCVAELSAAICFDTREEEMKI